MQVYNYPVVNHGRVRGLLQRLRSRMMQVQGERAALQAQLAQLPLEGHDSQTPFRAKVCPATAPCSVLVSRYPKLTGCLLIGTLQIARNVLACEVQGGTRALCTHISACVDKRWLCRTALYAASQHCAHQV